MELYADLYIWFIRHVWIMGFFRHYWKWATLFLSIKKKVSNVWVITDPFHYYQSATKYLNESTLSCVLILLKMMWIIKVILALINFCRSHMKFNIHFDEGFEVCGNLLDISTTFDKVWHEGLLVKLRRSGISG